MLGCFVPSTIVVLFSIVVLALGQDPDLTSPASSDDIFLQDIEPSLDQAEDLPLSQSSWLLAPSSSQEDFPIGPSLGSGLLGQTWNPVGSPNDLSSSLSNSPTSLFAGSTQPKDLTFDLSDDFKPFFADDGNDQNDGSSFISSKDDAPFDDTVELADCLLDESFPVINKKTRVKRVKGSGTCKTLDNAPPTAGDKPSRGNDDENLSVSNLLRLMSDPRFMDMSKISRINNDWNQYCYLLTDGLLPWGVCSSGNPFDQQTLSWPLNVFDHDYDPCNLLHCKLGTFPVQLQRPIGNPPKQQQTGSPSNRRRR